MFSFCACVPQSKEASMEAMDTYMNFKVFGSNSMYAIEEIQDEVKALEGSLSATDKKSEIFGLNNNGQAKLSGDTIELVNRSLELCDSLGGALDISVYPIVREWGFISGDYKVPSGSEIEELLTKVNYKNIKVDNNTVTLKDGMQLDLGAVAKGYAADKCLDIVGNEALKSAILNFGGTVATYGLKPDGSRWKVAITDPDNTSEYFGYLSCETAVVATSGGYERYFEKDGKTYIHIINPETGYPVDNGVKSVSVVCSEGVYADALSTALYVMGKDKAMEYFKKHRDFDFIILTDDNKMYISSGISADFTLCDGYDYEIVNIL